ncbi:MAG: hypothetical protein HQL51_13160 [Magnetococcales bacterium]|nr:hypothetical protein [Magnetococcales bacterium]
MSSTAERGRACPHCGQTLALYSTSPFTYSDGLGWGSQTLHVCFNDECPIFVNGWLTMERYGRVGSQRYWYNPVDKEDGVLPVANHQSMRGDILGQVA